MTAFVEEYRNLGRDGWPAGEWDNEPDKVVWVDEASGLDCMARRGGGGAWCGYVGVPDSHPWHGKGYGDCVTGCGADYCEHEIDSLTEVHGGLTFAAACNDTVEVGHGICHIPQPGRPADVWWFGFDCSHAWDLRPESLALAKKYPGLGPIHGDVYRNLDYVIREVSSLAAQLAKAAS